MYRAYSNLTVGQAWDKRGDRHARRRTTDLQIWIQQQGRVLSPTSM